MLTLGSPASWVSAKEARLNRFSVLVAFATFFLIIAGALVDSNDAELATLKGSSIFQSWLGNLFWEHGDRLVVTSVGMLTIAQGFLVGLTVKLMLPLAVYSAALFTIFLQLILGATL